MTGDIEALMPQQTPTVAAIYGYHKAKGDAEPQRGYLGASIIGHECDRFLWLTFRGVLREEKDGRVYRLLETGDLAEERLLRELRAIGCTVFDRDEKGGQLEVLALGGHLSGHLDGVATGLPEAPKTAHLIETKTANDDNFRKIQKDGVRKAKPMHFAQMQTYMGLMDLTRALYLVVNKDTDAIYGERVEFEPEFFKARVLGRAKRIIETSQAPEKCATRADDYRCKFCPGHALCWGDEKAAVPIKGGQTCRSCCHATPVTDQPGARWDCAKYQQPILNTDVGAECPGHLLLPGLVSFAEPTDADADWIEFTNRDGVKWRLGQEPGQWPAKQLMAERGPLDPPKAPEAPLGPDPRGPAGAGAPAVSAPPAPAGSATTASRSEREHVAWSCSGGYDNCGAAWCAKHHGELFLCTVCNEGEGTLAAECPGRTVEQAIESGETLTGDEAVRAREKIDEAAGRVVAEAALLAIDLGDVPLLSRYPWQDSERLWDGPIDQLATAIWNGVGCMPESLPEPHRTQDDASVNASEHVLPSGDYLIVHYRESGKAAIWRGKE